MVINLKRGGEEKEQGQGGDNTDEEKKIVTRIGEVILTRRRDDYDNDRRSDIDKAKRLGEDDYCEVKRRGEENCNKDKEKTITTRITTVTLKRQRE